MALPAQAKEEVIDHWPPASEADSSKDDPDQVTEADGDKDPGVTPPLMSPLASPLSGMVSPFPPGAPGVDPRQILHLLARKVQKLFAEISSNDKTILIKV